MFTFGSTDEAFLGPRYALYPHLTVFKNIQGDLLLRGWDSRRIKDRIAAMEVWPWLAPILYVTYQELPEKQRFLAALARAVAPGPEKLALELPPATTLQDPELAQAIGHLRTAEKIIIRQVPPETGTAWPKTTPKAQ